MAEAATAPLDMAAADALVMHVVLTDEGRQNPYDGYDQLRRDRPRHESIEEFPAQVDRSA